MKEEGTTPQSAAADSSPLRTETPLWDVPVLRMAYFLEAAHSAVSKKTHMLQVRCANPTGNFAPTQLFELRRCCGRLIFRKEYTVLFSPKRSTFRFASLTLRTLHRPIVSSPLAAAAALWLPCVRGAVRRRAGLRGCRRVGGKGEGKALPQSPHRTSSSSCSGVPVGLLS